MKPAVRLSALMRLHVIYVWTHDSFRVGEDGPTHQPVEHEAQIRLMEHLRNHHGERSMVVLRPADGEETVMAWQTGRSRSTAPWRWSSRARTSRTCRRWAPEPPRGGRSRSVKGGYVVMDAAKPAGCAGLASGSEVATLVEGAELLADGWYSGARGERPERGTVPRPAQIVSGERPAAWRCTLRHDVGSVRSTCSGLWARTAVSTVCDHFGYSAPYKVLDEKFGYNGATVYEEVKALIKG